MKKLKLLAKFAATAAFLSLLLTGCSGLGPGNTGYSNGSGSSGSSSHEDVDKAIKGPLTVVETWPGEDDEGEPITYYINSTYTIKQGGALTIEEGAIVKLGPNGIIEVDENGSLVARDVIFTSSKDSRGRKILAAGEAAPYQGDWKQIRVYGGHAEFYGCEFSYGGNGTCSTVNVKKSGSSATCRIDGCKFTNCSGSRKIDSTIAAALRYDDSLTFANDENTPDNKKNIVTNSTFENNVWPLSVPVYFDVYGSNHFKDNEYNMIHFDNDINTRRVKRNAVWETQEIPYFFSSSNKIEIQNGASITIKGGTVEKPTVIEFDKGGLTIVEGGHLYLEDNIKFTNCEKSPETNFDGLYCGIKRKVLKIGTTSTYITISYLVLRDNPSMNIVIENYTTTAIYDDDYKEYREQIISSDNYYVDETRS